MTVDNATYPKMLGIHYRPDDFLIDPLSLSEPDFAYQVDADVLAKLQQAGGSIKKLSNTVNLQDDETEDLFVLQHYERCQAGLLIKIPNHFELDEILDLKLDLKNNDVQYFSIQIEMGENSRIRLRQTMQYQSENHPISTLIGGTLADGSHLHVDNYFNNDDRMKLIMLGDWQVGKDAEINWTILPELSGQILGDLKIDLNGAGSSAYLNLACTGQPQDDFGIQGQINHRVEHTFSRIKMRGVVHDHAKVNLTSIGQIDHGAHGSDADQESRLMTVGAHAKGTVNPVLVIDENDVRAGHAASVGQYDEDELYYLQSRGLSLPVAQKILIDNFMEPIMKLVQGDRHD